jgi:hypothetical protein
MPVINPATTITLSITDSLFIFMLIICSFPIVPNGGGKHKGTRFAGDLRRSRCENCAVNAVNTIIPQKCPIEHKEKENFL